MKILVALLYHFVPSLVCFGLLSSLSGDWGDKNKTYGALMIGVALVTMYLKIHLQAERLDEHLKEKP
jgi:hypothetical protein